jgi:hypothetical protein
LQGSNGEENMRVVTLDSWRKARVIATDGAWGSSKSRFSDWAVGETVVMLVTREGVVTANVAGPRFKADAKAWDSDICEWRVPLVEVALAEGAAGQGLNASIRDVLRHCYGEPVYFRILLSGMKLGDEPESRIRELLRGPASAQ